MKIRRKGALYLLMIFKVAMVLVNTCRQYISWNERGLLAHNSFTVEFVVVPFVKLGLGFLPYVLLYFISQRYRLEKSFLILGILLLLGDFYSEFQFLGSKDAQTGLAMAMVYSIYAAVILLAASIYGVWRNRK